ncbi:glycosyl hydrolase [Butyrivibrio sp. CB08]|uniref:glycoside hydrolase family 3 C-terminal domain-containing protein n=1 Tax=Butyrivibrio sp. CB08 TaxID=2364879 RepID=UPI000EAABAA7|nr:glycoside hydrolase family 3 C-terminal domain-containing protein [Butyrivibrio sp. CB08]RKM61982.1 glycosyl hydrolase [Butyrivibrio sp. CB08]
MNVKDLVSKMTLQEKASLLSGCDFWHTTAVERLGLSEFMMCDGPNGLRKQEGETDHLGLNSSISTVCYPTASAVASSFDVDLAWKLGQTLGRECQRENVAMLLGPGLNMKRSPVCGRNFEYYSEDPYLAGKIAAAYVNGIQSEGVAACPKHFAANNQEYRRMSGNSTVDERTLHEIYLTAFEIMVKESHPKSIMCAYNQLNGTYLSENKYMLTDVLRDKWGFDGFVVTDWGAGKGPKEGVEAGLDLVMPGPRDDHEKAIIKAVESGELAEEKVDRAVTNILNTLNWTLENKKDYGPSTDETRALDYAFAKELAQESAVLLKNENKALPLKDGNKILFVGEFAKAPRYQGSGSSHINSAYVSNAVDSARAAGKEISFALGYDSRNKDLKNSYILLEEAVEAAREADIIVIFAGLPGSYESEGFDRKDINLPPEQDKLIDELSHQGKKTVVVMHNGAPVAMPWIESVDAVLDMQLAGDAVGDATVSLLWGDVVPSGKLAESYPFKLTDNPSFLNFPGDGGNPVYAEGIYIGYRYYEKKRRPGLFPFGHGLSYTEFEYSDIKVSKDSITDKDNVDVSVEIWNIGRYLAKEVVQLYVSPGSSKVSRPYKELKGFTKVELSPGEKKVVTFTLDSRAFAYYETKIHDFYVPSGDYSIMIGSSVNDIRQTAEVHVESTSELPITFDQFTAIEDILDTKKGQAILGPVLQQMNDGMGESEDDDALGEGGAEMFEKMILEMPIINLASFGILSTDEVNGILEKLNG